MDIACHSSLKAVSDIAEIHDAFRLTLSCKDHTKLSRLVDASNVTIHGADACEPHP